MRPATPIDDPQKVGCAAGSNRTQERGCSPAAREEPSSWSLFISFALAALGAYALLAVHLVLEATNASGWMLAWMAAPATLFCASAVALFVGSDLSPRERLTAIRTGIFGYSPRE